ncbi:glycosyltransferase involved in cell wall biosynthesis [Parabacteroides sp. PF5-5]|uniref:glycosyltransferase family 2 protein n=1 Tax=unclassified Parabacteroides TaxID=2649774 RepID=UPI0024735CA7|nr:MULTISPECIES: glycosyltransferase family 2 protein [unclassified Parabacteroides]MDH6303387.1 glycosyltransferase involved in cell wall biosynthesis [Parabacteroides sp. PH5-39]MDH6314710.1 glycosyltransferase involved in cell wall biosynthesis [Parabacteroides sp. PF5-13]MDH6318047.1 glycosyltransferase involved in cell wall biosynthesis [Parabacteroides sp. PH5-13]MDH6322022.1 glycosyltransferase involved in cell wall biosynthesis [Parabacteroides sp. PH5-8]MDH6326145.1 glycosyltransferas
MKISVVINTYNAEKHLERVLESVKAFDEVLICDMYSTDKTIEIAKKYNCTIVHHEKTGYVEPARNFAIQAAKHDWVFVVDADEFVPAKLRSYLYEQIKQDNPPSGIMIPRKNYFMNRFMRCTYPDYLHRFIKKADTDWPVEIHSHPKINGIVKKIPKKRKDLAFIHLANESIYDNINKTNKYSDFEVEKRKKKKYGYCSLLNETIFRFFKFYIIKGAIRDGKAGLIYAGLLSIYKYLTIAKVWESKIKYNDLEKDLQDSQNR